MRNFYIPIACIFCKELGDFQPAHLGQTLSGMATEDFGELDPTERRYQYCCSS